MNTIDVKSLIDRDLQVIWNNKRYQEEPITAQLIGRGYLACQDMEKEALLFVGINPSYTKAAANNALSGNFGNLKQAGNSYKAFFRKFEEIAEEKNQLWTHLDLLFFRETQQKMVEKLSRDKTGREFLQEQIKLSEKVLKNLDPKIIIVSNTAARDLICKKEWLGYTTEFNSKLGTRILKFEDKSHPLHNKPIFFTSMLTGQRALDNGSFERLKWHIDFVLDQL